MVIYRLNKDKSKEYLEKLSSDPILSELCPYIEDKYGKGRYFLSSWVDETGKKTDRIINTLDYTRNFRTNKIKGRELATTKENEMENQGFNLKDLLGAIGSIKGQNGIGDAIGHILPIIQSIEGMNLKLDRINEKIDTLNEKISQLEEDLFSESVEGDGEKKDGLNLNSILDLVSNQSPEAASQLKNILGLLNGGNESFSLADIIAKAGAAKNGA